MKSHLDMDGAIQLSCPTWLGYQFLTAGVVAFQGVGLISNRVLNVYAPVDFGNRPF